MRKIAAVFLKESEYAVRFLKYIKQVPNLSYEMVYFSEEQVLKQYLREHKVELFLTQDRNVLSPDLMEQVEQVIEFVDEIEKQTEEGVEGKVRFWYQYQSMECLLPYLTKEEVPTKQVSVESSIKPKIAKKTQKIFSVLALEDALHCEDVVYQIATQLQGSQSVLLLDFTQFGGVSLSLDVKAGQKQDTNTLSDLIYEIREQQGIEEFAHFIRRCRSISYISSANYGVDLMDVQWEESDQMLKLFEQTEYDCILILISFLSEGTIQMLNQSDSILYLNSCEVSKEIHLKIKTQVEQIISSTKLNCLYEFDQTHEKGLSKEQKRVLEKALEEAV